MKSIKDYVYNSNYKTPYIVYKREFSVGCAEGGIARTNFAHGLPFKPLLIGQWSLNSNFTPSYDLSQSEPLWGGSRALRRCYIGADESNVYVSLMDDAYEGNVTFYFRIMAFAPPQYEGDIPVVYQDSGNFISDSRRNYPKIWFLNQVPQSTTIEHNFGYLPQVKSWNTIEIPINANFDTKNVLAPSMINLNPIALNDISVSTRSVAVRYERGDEQYLMILGDEQ